MRMSFDKFCLQTTKSKEIHLLDRSTTATRASDQRETLESLVLNIENLHARKMFNFKCYTFCM